MHHSGVSAQYLNVPIKTLISLLIIFKRFPLTSPVRIASMMCASHVSTFADDVHVGPRVCHFRPMEVLLSCVDRLYLGLETDIGSIAMSSS